MPLGELLEKIQPQDLVKFGLIPEFVGRIPIITHVDDLDEADLVRILTEPKNALVRQYQKLFELDHVQLRFTPNALKAIAAGPSSARPARAACATSWSAPCWTSCSACPPCPVSRNASSTGPSSKRARSPVLLYDESAEGAAADTSLN